MKAESLKNWRNEVMHMSQREACAALGYTLKAYQELERGSRFADDSPAPIPLCVAYACAAIAAGISPFGEHSAPIGKSKASRKRATAESA